MKQRNRLQTVRLSKEEKALVDEYLMKNPVFESFSSLARVATLTFIGSGGNIRLEPAGTQGPAARPSFLWDYDLSVAQVREILARPGDSETKRWLIGRILSQARSEEVLSFLTVEQIRKALPVLRLPPKVRARWEYAVARWTKHG
jgi:hypothetical protein